MIPTELPKLPLLPRTRQSLPAITVEVEVAAPDHHDRESHDSDRTSADAPLTVYPVRLAPADTPAESTIINSRLVSSSTTDPRIREYAATSANVRRSTRSWSA